MSTECKMELERVTQQRDYYKQMYEMRTEAYIIEIRRLEDLMERYQNDAHTCIKEFAHFKDAVRRLHKIS